MKVIITMAGKGSRFSKKKYEEPKYKVVVNGISIFEWSLSSLKYFYESEFIFIGRSDNWDESFVKTVCSKLGISKVRFILLDKDTEGQAATAMHADNLIDEKDSVLIFNIDTYVDPESLKDVLHGNPKHGVIPVFSAEGDRWSFVEENIYNQVTRVVEKIRISEWATIGLYYFPNWGGLKNTFKRCRKEVKSLYGEVYVAPLYQYLIDKKLVVIAPKIQTSKVKIFGTPEDIKSYLEGQSQLEMSH